MGGPLASAAGPAMVGTRGSAGPVSGAALLRSGR